MLDYIPVPCLTVYTSFIKMIEEIDQPFINSRGIEELKTLIPYLPNQYLRCMKEYILVYTKRATNTANKLIWLNIYSLINKELNQLA